MQWWCFWKSFIHLVFGGEAPPSTTEKQKNGMVQVGTETADIMLEETMVAGALREHQQLL